MFGVWCLAFDVWRLVFEAPQKASAIGKLQMWQVPRSDYDDTLALSVDVRQEATTGAEVRRRDPARVDDRSEKLGVESTFRSEIDVFAILEIAPSRARTNDR